MSTTYLYPAIEPYNTLRLKVDEIHELYIEEAGNPNGIPIIYFHGGPGFGCNTTNRRYFDPAIFRIILFDQRGAGRSLPFAEIRKNTTSDLIHDIEIIRHYLKIDEWILFGGSWGSTLSLVYAETYPTRVLGLILRGVFLGREQDIKWFFNGGGAKEIYPDKWQDFIAIIPKEERSHLLEAYYRRLLNPDQEIQMQAANAWVTWQATCATLKPNELLLAHVKNPQVALSAAKLECHYYLNACFLEPNHILKNIVAIQDKPCHIIHGRYDLIFPFSNAWALHQAWPSSLLTIVDEAGHAASELGITTALIAATKQISSLYKERVSG